MSLDTLADVIPYISSPFAMIAFLALVLMIWAIGARTRRAKVLIENLHKLPEEDRILALKAEFGSVELREGLSADQYLRGRIAFYKFIGNLALIAAVVMVVAIIFQHSLQDIASDPPRTRSSAHVDQEPGAEGTAPTLASKNARTPDLDALSIGASKNYVTSKIGHPKYQNENEKDRDLYIYPDHLVYVIYRENKVAAFGFTALKKSFKPTFAYGNHGSFTLGETTFESGGGKPAHAATSSKIWNYVEKLDGSATVFGGVSVYLIDANTGFEWTSMEDCFFKEISEGLDYLKVQFNKRNSIYMNYRKTCRVTAIGFADANLDAIEEADFKVWHEWPDHLE